MRQESLPVHRPAKGEADKHLPSRNIFMPVACWRKRHKPRGDACLEAWLCAALAASRGDLMSQAGHHWHTARPSLLDPHRPMVPAHAGTCRAAEKSVSLPHVSHGLPLRCCRPPSAGDRPASVLDGSAASIGQGFESGDSKGLGIGDWGMETTAWRIAVALLIPALVRPMPHPQASSRRP